MEKTSVGAPPGITFEDLSGASAGTFDNPYDALLVATENDAAKIQERYSTHCATRNRQQKEKLLDPNFYGMSIDPILYRIIYEPDFVDPRYCLVFWARPTQRVKELVARVQQELLQVVPNLWLMPIEHLHLTVLEMTHSKTEAEVNDRVNKMLPSVSPIVDHTLTHHARLIKPTLSSDPSAFALSFLPAVGEAPPPGRTAQDDQYTYHHLRRDIYGLASATGVPVESRYTVPSSHLTIGRFVTQKDVAVEGADPDDLNAKPDPEKMRNLVEKVEEVNGWLKREYWPKEDGTIKEGGEWIVGQEKGLDFREGNLWYGGGMTVMLGEGF